MFERVSAALGVLCALTIAGPAMAADAANGELVFKKRCVACHTVEEGKNKVGPSLFGVAGRKAGTIPKFKYSESYVAAGEKGLTWAADQIVPYLEDPKEFMEKFLGDPKAKSKMVFKLKPENERRDVAAYLVSIK